MDFFSSTKVDNIKKFCYDKGELDELKDFYKWWNNKGVWWCVNEI